MQIIELPKYCYGCLKNIPERYEGNVLIFKDYIRKTDWEEIVDNWRCSKNMKKIWDNFGEICKTAAVLWKQCTPADLKGNSCVYRSILSKMPNFQSLSINTYGGTEIGSSTEIVTIKWYTLFSSTE